MVPFKTTSLNVSAGAVIGNGLTVTGNISASNIVYALSGNSSLWNSTYTNVQSNSASWEESVDVLPTVTNYLSTSNVLMSEATIINDLIVGGTVYSSGSAEVLAKYTEIVGNGTSFNINHNFLTSDVQVQVYKVSDGVLSYPTIEITSISAVTVKFAQSIPAASYKVIVHGTVPSNQINAYGSIAATETFESVSKNLKSYPYTVNYTDNILTSIEYTLPGNKYIVKMFEYTNSLLTSVSLSGDIPSGINTTKSLSYTVNNVLTGISYSL